MNKPLKILTGLALTTSLTVATINSAEASSSRVMWGKTELKIGQIGKVTILKNTDLVKLNNDGTLSTVRKLKKGDEFRVYQYKGQHGGLYGVGDSSFVQKNDTKVFYETPSKSKLELVKGEGVKIPPVNGTDKVVEIFNDVLDDSYKISTVDSSVDAYFNSKLVLSYDKDEKAGKSYFFIEDVTKVNEAYKIMKKLGFSKSEAELKALIKKSDSSDKAITEGSLYVHASSSMIQIRW